MLRKVIFIAATFILLSGLAAISLGQIRYTPRHHHSKNGIKHRQLRQQRRIARGIRHHKLSARESGRLERSEAKTNRLSRRYRKSGHGLSHTERHKLNHRLDRTNRTIQRETHRPRRRHTIVRHAIR